MITFSIKLLLAFSLKFDKNPKSKEKKPKPEKVKKEIKQQKEAHAEEVVDPPYLIRLEKNCSTAHLEYELIPGKCKTYQIDVLCWKNAAKICSSDGTKFFKTFSRNDLTFVPICVTHTLKELSIDELIALRNATIEFNVFTDKNRLGNVAKSNKSEMVFIRESDIEKLGFVEAFAEKLNSSNATKKSNYKSMGTEEDVVSRSTTSQRQEVWSKMIFGESFADELYEIIDYVSDSSIPREKMFFTDFTPSCDLPKPTNDTAKPDAPKTTPKQDKKSTKSSKTVKAEKIPTKLTLQIQGEIFFTESNSIFKVENDKCNVSKLFVLPRVENLLNRVQKIHLNPIVIKIKAIENFPEELFEETGIVDIFCKYTIPFIAECKTIEKPIARTITFRESHIFPTHTLSKIKLLEFLEAQRFLVEIYGIQRNKEVKMNPKLFGEKPEDNDISKIHVDFHTTCVEGDEQEKTRNILLAYCSYDLSSLLNNVWDFRAREQLHTPESKLISTIVTESGDTDPNSRNTCEFWYRPGISMNHINLAEISFNPNHSPLREWMLIEKNTVLSLEAYLLSPQSAALVLHQVPNTYKRLFVILFTKELATEFFGNILRYNQRIMCQQLNTNDMLTGFMIDNGNNVVVYAEGCSVGYILNLWQSFENVSLQEAKVFFNTDKAYEQRLYNVCNKWSGFCMINMKIPLQHIFKNQKTYIKGNMPLLCQKALVKLQLIFLSNTIRNMYQNNLFPTIDELLSLEIEFGVPYAWKARAPSVGSSDTDQQSIQQSVRTTPDI